MKNVVSYLISKGCGDKNERRWEGWYITPVAYEQQVAVSTYLLVSLNNLSEHVMFVTKGIWVEWKMINVSDITVILTTFYQ